PVHVPCALWSAVAVTSRSLSRQRSPAAGTLVALGGAPFLADERGMHQMRNGTLRVVGESRLYIEEEATAGFGFRDAVCRAGWHVEPVRTGEQALTKIDSGAYGLVIVGFKLPGVLQGLGVCAYARDRLPAAGIAVLSASEVP